MAKSKAKPQNASHHVGYSLQGIARLSRVIKASLSIQTLSYRDVETLSARFYNGEALNKNTVGSYVRAAARSVSPFAAQKFAPFTFKVVGFNTSVEPLGFPVFESFGCIPFYANPQDFVGEPEIPSSKQYNEDDYNNLMQALTPEQMPDADIRNTNFNTLIQIALWDSL